MVAESSNDIVKAVTCSPVEQQKEQITVTAQKTAMEERNLYTFQSKIQEGLSLKEIMVHLQPRSASSLTEKRKMLCNIVKERDIIFTAFVSASKKLGSSFLCCLPQKSEMAEKSKRITCYKDVIVRTIFKLAILFDVYATIQGHALDPKTEKLFKPLVAEVVKAKNLARQQRNKININNRVKNIIDGIVETSLAESGFVPGKEMGARHVHFVGFRVEAQKRAISRYRSLLGLGKKAISKSQLHRLVFDLVRNDNAMNVRLATAALDEVLGISENANLQHASLQTCPPRAIYNSSY